MKSSINFRSEIQRHVATSGVNLPDATVDELYTLSTDPGSFQSATRVVQAWARAAS